MKTKTKAARKPAVAKYPMHEKLKALGERRSTVQDFIDWLYDGKSWWICEELKGRNVDERLIPIRIRREDIMADYFGIDLTVLDDEKRAMLDHIRKLNQE